MTKMLTYISGPFTAMSKDLEAANIQEAKRWGLMVRDAGCTDLVPHIAVNAGPEMTWGEAMGVCLAYLAVCDAIFMMPTWENSKGARMELEFAKEWGLPVFYSLGDLEAWVEEAQ